MGHFEKQLPQVASPHLRRIRRPSRAGGSCSRPTHVGRDVHVGRRDEGDEAEGERDRCQVSRLVEAVIEGEQGEVEPHEVVGPAEGFEGEVVHAAVGPRQRELVGLQAVDVDRPATLSPPVQRKARPPIEASSATPHVVNRASTPGGEAAASPGSDEHAGSDALTETAATPRAARRRPWSVRRFG